MIELRDYQRDAIDSLYTYFEQHDGHPLIVLPTGSGKSVVIAAFLREVMQHWPSQRIVMLTHVKELIAQNHQKLVTLWPEAPVGVYSAGLRSRDTCFPITFAGIQSVHRKPQLFGHVDLVIIDEAHLVSKSAEGIYRDFLGALAERNPALKVIGLTATPYRLRGGFLHEGDERLFTHIAYDLPVTTLIERGYLCPLVPKQVQAEIDTSQVHSRAGEFVARELEAAAQAGDIVARAVAEIVQHGQDRRSWLVFCTGVDHAQAVLAELRRHSVPADIVLGTTPAAERDRILDDYKASRLRAVVNVSVLTTGFDAPETDLLAVLRPTQSTGLWVQIAGRGMRIAPGKSNCLVLDFGGNVRRHGPIDRVNPKAQGTGNGEALAKPCPECATLLWLGARECPECGYEFPKPEDIGPRHDAQAATDALLSTLQKPVTHDVEQVVYARHTKPGGAPSLRVEYLCGLHRFCEWVCLEHTGYARHKAERWWMIRSGEGIEWVPPTIEDALDIARGLRTPTTITVTQEGKYDRIIGYGWHPREAATPQDHQEPARADAGHGA